MYKSKLQIFMKIITKTLIVGTLPCIISCSTITFVNGPELEQTIQREQWHHVGLNGLIEYSKPMNLDYYCGDQQWDSVTVEKTVFNSLMGTTPHPAVSVYTPWTIFYECREPID